MRISTAICRGRCTFRLPFECLPLVADTPSRENDIEGIVELTFSIDDEKFGERATIDLIPDGRNIPVTNENKHKYVE